MNPLFIRILSEGLQAFMPIAVALGWTLAEGLDRAAASIRRGVLAAVPISLAAGYLFDISSHHIEWETALAAVAVVLTASFGSLVWRGRPSPSSGALMAAAVLLVVRETMMIVSVLLTVVFGLRSTIYTMLVAQAVGLALLCAYGWVGLARRLPVRAVWHATSAFIVVFFALALMAAFHKATELRLLPVSDLLHVATEPYGPDGMIGQYFSGLLVAVPLAVALTTASLHAWAQTESL